MIGWEIVAGGGVFGPCQRNRCSSARQWGWNDEGLRPRMQAGEDDADEQEIVLGKGIK
jgi:hypothetical protein